VPDSAGFVAYANNVFREVLDVPALGEIPEYQGATFSTNDIAGQQAVAIRTARLLSVLIYSFAAFLTLIGLTNIISTVSANTRLRAREFAMLQSVGMTRGGLSRMLNLECLLLGAKSLALGVPLGLMASLMIHAALVQTALTEFFFPWASIAECAVGVFAITLITMRVAARRVRGGSIIEVIRSSNGV
jgi:putative ABC transport system permease protein